MYEDHIVRDFMGSAVGFKKIGSHDPCPCSSGKKFKKCCMNRFKKQGPKKKWAPDDNRDRE